MVTQIMVYDYFNSQAPLRRISSCNILKKGHRTTVARIRFAVWGKTKSKQTSDLNAFVLFLVTS